MQPTELFVYGTLRHDQAEHAKYCRGVTGWRPARLRGQLWMLSAGYRIVTVAPEAVLLAATIDADVDEARRAALSIPIRSPATDASAGWIDGELLSFRDAVAAWPPLDGWEEFSPVRPERRCYARVVVPVEVVEAGETCLRPAWAYVATVAPQGAMPVVQ